MGLLVAACGGEEGTTTIGGREANDHGTEDVVGETAIGFEMDDFYFEPTVLQGEPGQSLTLEAFNEGEALHNLTISEQGIDSDLAAGEKTSIEVILPDSGTLVLECKYHASQGMIGALEVS
jgi:plastocyanin